MLAPESRWLIRVSWPFRRLYGKQVLVVVVASALALLDPLVIKWLIDHALPSQRPEWVLLAAATFFGVFLCSAGFNAWAQLIDAYTTQRLTIAVRDRLVRHLQRLSADYFLHARLGDLLHRIEQDVERVCTLGGRALGTLLRVVVITVASTGIMLTLSWRLTLLVLLAGPVILYLRRSSHPRLRKASDTMQSAAAARSAFLEQHLAAMTHIQLLDATARERRRFFAIQRDALAGAMRWHKAELLFFFSSQAGLMAASAAVLGFGGYEVLQGRLTIGSLMAFYGFVYRIFDPLEMAISLYANLQRASASIRRIMTVLDTDPTVRAPTHPQSIAARGPASISLRAIRFGYPGKTDILNHLDLEVAPGERVALVGPSGGGKSSIARLLARLYEPSAGTIEIDGVAIGQLDPSALRSHVALVPQEPYLFAISLAENLRMAAPRATDEAIRRALDTAQLADVAASLADDETIAQRGGSLSGGQRQRVAIARALLKRPRLLILDEATSALDGETERRLLTALDRTLDRDVTVMLIAHRLSAIRWADRIALVDDGQIVATGDHATLMRTCPRYQALCAVQRKQEQTEATGRDESSASDSIASPLATAHGG